MASKMDIRRLAVRVKENPIVVSLTILGSLIVALSTFTDAAKNLLGLAITESRPDVNGEWEAEVTYDWGAKHSETFTFDGVDEEVYGTASFLGVKRGIVEGMARKDTVQFRTETQEVMGGENRPAVHRYRGQVFQDEIKFVMQTEGGFSGHVPIEFTARRVANAPVQPARS